jgi:hypothetical protein
METAKGELMDIQNFGILEGLSSLRPEDYINYLKMVSAQNPRITSPQFHAVISCEGRQFDKTELTSFAKQWLKEMGYAQQPYLIIFHKDTEHNHVHMVSTRVDKDGKTINNSFEKNRAVHAINKIMGLDERQEAGLALQKALTYGFSTKAQFLLLLEAKGYTIKEADKTFQIIKFGKVQESIPIKLIENKIANRTKDPHRVFQIRAIMEKYKRIYDPRLITLPEPNKTGAISKAVYTSPLASYLKQHLGLELCFHASGDKAPYGYTVIDHTRLQVFKGSDILGLRELIGNNQIEVEPMIGKTNYQYQSDFGINLTDEINDTNNLENPKIMETTNKPNDTYIQTISLNTDQDDEKLKGKKRKRPTNPKR